MMMESIHDQMTEYAILLFSGSENILVQGRPGDLRLPRVHVPSFSRHAEEIQRACRSDWGLDIFVTGFLPQGTSREDAYVVAELLDWRVIEPTLQSIPLNKLLERELESELADKLSMFLSKGKSGSIPHIGWIQEAIAWVETTACSKLISASCVDQINAGIGFCLIRFPMESGKSYWLKTTGSPNKHEYDITLLLSARDSASSAFLPEVAGSHGGWNAWLMTGDGAPLPDVILDQTGSVILQNIVVSLARLQVAALPVLAPLAAAGAFDKSLSRFAISARELGKAMELAMRYQTSRKVATLSPLRLQEIAAWIPQACEEVSKLAIPLSLVHGDLNRGNILLGQGCHFIDWSEAGIGFPPESLQHVLLLNRIQNVSMREHVNQALKDAYRDEWRHICDPGKMTQSFRYMPLLAATSALYGRGDWLNASERDATHRFPLVRTLARHLDRAVRDLEQDSASCM